MKRFITLILLLLSFPVLAQETNSTLEDELPQKITDDPHDTFITLVYENDLIGRGTDQNYTNGIRLTYFDLKAEFPDIAHKIADYVPTFSINRTSSIYYSVGHNLYTPVDIESSLQDPQDRPWAAFLYGSIGMSTLTDNHVDDLEVTLGIVGPLALGEQVQKAVHRHITGSPVPQGWDNQLENEPGLILSW